MLVSLFLSVKLTYFLFRLQYSPRRNGSFYSIPETNCFPLALRFLEDVLLFSDTRIRSDGLEYLHLDAQWGKFPELVKYQR